MVSMSTLFPGLLLLVGTSGATATVIEPWVWTATSAFAPSQSALVVNLTANANATGKVVVAGVTATGDGSPYACGAFSGSVDFAGGTAAGNPTIAGFRPARGAAPAHGVVVFSRIQHPAPLLYRIERDHVVARITSHARVRIV